jgi:hypothetical protein
MIYQILVRPQSDQTWKPFGLPTSDPFTAMRLIQQANSQHNEVTVLQAESLSAVRALLERLERGELPPEAVSIAPSLTSTPKISVQDGFWELRRWDLEQGAGGDHDTPYRFELPANAQVVAAWLSLMANRRRRAEGDGEVA